MAGRRQLLAFATPFALAAAAAVLFLVRGTTVETSVYAMLGDGAPSVPADVRDESSRTAFVVFSSGSAAASRAASERFLANLPPELAASLAPDFGADSLKALSKRADGLVAPADRVAIATPEGRAKVARAAVRRYVASPVPPAFAPDEDPFCLKERFVASLGDSPDAIAVLPLRAEAVAGEAALGSVAGLLERAVEAARREAGPDMKVMPCGVPLHTLRAVSKCRRETGLLSILSSIVIAAVALFAFRPVSRAAYAAANLLSSVSAGAAALFLLFPSFHVATAVLGTSVLGLVADYSFHWLLRAPGEGRATARNLAVSFATTALALAPLALSPLPVLRESAVFLAAALAASFAFVVLTHPAPAASRVDAEPAGGGAIRVTALCAVVAICAAAACAAPRFVVKTDATSLYVPPAEFLEPERILAAKWAPPPGEVAENVRRLYAEQGANVAEALGLARPPAPPTPPQGVAAALADALCRLTDETARRLSYALLAMLVALVAVFRLRAVAVAAPSAVAFFAAASAVSLYGGSINLFHLLAGFLLAGMCVDYAVFLSSGDRGALKSVTCSFLTSFVGFGALAFVSFRPVAAFGTVLGAGLPAGYLAAVALWRRPAEWRRPTTERATSPLGMEVLWICYLFFGVGVLRFMARCVASCAWLFIPAVRKASPSRRKVAMFAQMLADKVALCSGRGRPSRVRDDGSSDARAFAADVAAGRGVFVLSSHCGSPEMLLALAESPPTFHAWTDLDRTAAFNEFYFRHARKGGIEFHSIADIGIDTAFAAMQWLERGECLVMAGDRGRGAFRFAAALGHPVYFATCIADGPGYVAVVRSLQGTAAEMESAFLAIHGELVRRHPEQLYEWRGGE